ncbi:glycosyl hydrolase [Halobacillus andaensis]|uniref:4,4'-diaponeurosporenoate glycosyltransferase n=1 Tax=Halobacillus andaensis TaxID=1176239 RepID=A0A917AZL8_HALAA|nr:glycosyltransferase family 2 protein [Halobacillus andaensis]MBP2003189.1 glycosyltransferase involved in cell wall biosynthesis [Halobacillus andaensis]GGF08679.1 glycosyl hydrolase [Halobacillus andaensis]
MIIYFYILLLGFWIWILVEFLRGFKTIESIDHYPMKETPQLVSVIVAAKDEERHIEDTILSIVAQENIELELIVVNDRSSDRTKQIIDDISSRHSNVKAITITSLPNGWLGKNYALYEGVKLARSNYLLFTDADVVFDKTALARAFNYMVTHEADHVTVAPHLKASSFLLKGLISYFLFGFSYLNKPWEANKTSSKKGIGIGAFQLITRKCYTGVGGHERLRLRPDDDLALGQLVKNSRYKQRFVTSLLRLTVEWYPNLNAAFKGFEKNAFAGLNYSYFMAGFAITGVIISQIFPFWHLFYGSSTEQLLSGITVLLVTMAYTISTLHFTRYPIWIVVGWPLFSLLFVYMLSRALLLTMTRKEISWRDSRYSIDELKKFYKDTK